MMDGDDSAVQSFEDPLKPPLEYDDQYSHFMQPKLE
jgi:hypothetical protein